MESAGHKKVGAARRARLGTTKQRHMAPSTSSRAPSPAAVFHSIRYEYLPVFVRCAMRRHSETVCGFRLRTGWFGWLVILLLQGRGCKICDNDSQIIFIFEGF